jgi:hypothetical protein
MLDDSSDRRLRPVPHGAPPQRCHWTAASPIETALLAYDPPAAPRTNFRKIFAILFGAALLIFLSGFERVPRTFNKSTVREQISFAKEARNDVTKQMFWSEPNRIPFFCPVEWVTRALSPWRAASRGGWFRPIFGKDKVKSSYLLKARLCRLADEVFKEECIVNQTAECIRLGF